MVTERTAIGHIGKQCNPKHSNRVELREEGRARERGKGLRALVHWCQRFDHYCLHTDESKLVTEGSGLWNFGFTSSKFLPGSIQAAISYCCHVSYVPRNVKTCQEGARSERA